MTLGIPPGSKGFRLGEMMGLKAGDELEDRLCAREEFLNGRRTLLLAFKLGVVDVIFGSYEEGIEMKDGLPMEGPALIGPKVGVDPADLTVAGEVSEL
jgi:hypothetical protein